MYKAIIFDFFDVVHQDPQKSWFKAHGFDRTGGFAVASDQLDLGHIDYKTYLEQFALHSGQTIEQIQNHFETATIDQAMVDLIRSLRGTYLTGLLSNAHSDEARPKLLKHQIDALFDEIVISAEVGHAKPSPEIFFHILKQLAVKPSEAIFIDDNPGNVAAAELVGIKAICHDGTIAKLHATLHKLGVLTNTSKS